MSGPDAHVEFPLVIDAGAALDAAGTAIAPARIRLEAPGRIAAVEPRSGPEASVVGSDGPGWRGIDWSDRLVLPGLVNAHAHLDLTAIGPIPAADSFRAWVDEVRRRRDPDPAAIAASARAGIEASRRGGSVLVGDIAGVESRVPIEILLETADIGGSVYLEFFARGSIETDPAPRLGRLAAGLASLARPFDAERGRPPIRVGLQPHAPYSVDREAYEAAVAAARQHGLPLATHLAETREELEFVAAGTGPLADLLRAVGAWDDFDRRARGEHPVDHLAHVLRAGRTQPWLVAHANHVEDRHIDLLASSGTRVVYCPRASTYFGHVGHRYRDMLEAGVEVALGTDSILCLPPGTDRLGVLEEMAWLRGRDGTDAETLLRMATVAGARALGHDPELVTLSPGPTAGLVGVEVPAAWRPRDAARPRAWLEAVLDSSVPCPIHRFSTG